MPNGEPAGESAGKSQMTFMGHLMELRARLIIIFIAIAVCGGVSLFFSKSLFRLICEPLESYNRVAAKEHRKWLEDIDSKLADVDKEIATLPANDPGRGALDARRRELEGRRAARPTAPRIPLASEGPQTGFMSVIKIGLWAGLVLSLPIIISQLWGFVRPGLLEHERKAITPIFIFGIVFFVAGALIAYRWVVPMALTWLFDFNRGMDLMDITYISKYVNFVITLMLAFGIAFEMPLVVLGLSIVGLVTPRLLIRHGRYAILGAFILGALLTPPDWISQVMMATCLVGLYGISILFSYIVVRRRAAREADSESSTADGE